MPDIPDILSETLSGRLGEWSPPITMAELNPSRQIMCVVAKELQSMPGFLFDPEIVWYHDELDNMYTLRHLTTAYARIYAGSFSFMIAMHNLTIGRWRFQLSFTPAQLQGIFNSMATEGARILRRNPIYGVERPNTFTTPSN